MDTPDEVTPESWLLRYMAAGIDCVAVTDHNSGDWIDRLKDAYADLHGRREDGLPELHIFPGVEISVQGGFHLLAIFDPACTSRTISDLLAKVEYDGTEGHGDGTTRLGAADVVRKVVEAGGIAIPAHVDQAKGLLQVQPETRSTMLDANMVRQVLEEPEILAMEKVSSEAVMPRILTERGLNWTRVLGSDSHSFRGDRVPGSRFTWVKMARPGIEGLRLALLDGNGISIRCSDEGAFDPFDLPEHFIESIEVSDARFMGRGRRPETLAFSPYYNALIGGRGTGKSSIVHAVRLAYRRERELDRFAADSGPRAVFDAFAKVPRNRDDNGALSEETEIQVVVSRDGIRHRLIWRKDGEGAAVEEWQGDDWQASASQAVVKDRFPLRLLSQGQIAAMAGDNRQALLDIIDEAAGADLAKRALDEARQTYFTLAARLRELDGKLSGGEEAQRKLDDVKRRLEGLSRAQDAAVRRAFQGATRQGREVQHLLEQVKGFAERIKGLASEAVLDDWSPSDFDPGSDADILRWRATAEGAVDLARSHMQQAAEALWRQVRDASQQPDFLAWNQRVQAAQTDHEQLKTALAAEGIEDPQAFERLVQERQGLENALDQLERWQQDRAALAGQIEAQLMRVREARETVTGVRRAFLDASLAQNPFVRIEVVGFGHDPKVLERSLRDLLDVNDERFKSDILDEDPKTHERKGLIARLLANSDREAGVDRLKMELLDPSRLGGHFRNHLQTRLESQPELVDRICCWYPDDDLTIEYCRKGDGRDFTPIAQGSAGQRAAAMLAFLLAFGNEPLVLDQPEDDLDNHLIYELIVQQIRANKRHRQLIVVTHNPNIAVNGDAEMVHAFGFNGQCHVRERGALQERPVRDEVRLVMEGGQEALARRWARLGREL